MRRLFDRIRNEGLKLCSEGVREWFLFPSATRTIWVTVTDVNPRNNDYLKFVDMLSITRLDGRDETSKTDLIIDYFVESLTTRDTVWVCVEY